MAEHLNSVAQLRLQWLAGLSEEDKQKVNDDRASFYDEEIKRERMVER